MRPPLATALRVAGAVVALGYLLGLVSGPVAAPVGAFVVVTLGRMPAWRRTEGLVAGAGLAVLAGAVAIPVLRWATLDLGELRGVQAVLGPTVLVGPGAAAGAAWAGGVAGLLGLGVWLGPPGAPGERSPPAFAWWGFEAILGGLLLATVFWGPAVPGWGTGTVRMAGVGSWVAVALLAGGCAAGIGRHRDRMPRRALGGVVGASALLSAGAVLVIVLVS